MKRPPTLRSGFWADLPRPFSALAPMEDVTDTVFRRIVLEAGAPDVFYTEFTSTDGLCSRGRPRVIDRLRYTEGERPLVAQIWGNRPELYHRVAGEIQAMGFDGLDINMGCPVKKVVGRGSCAGLIANPSLAAELIAAAREGAPDLPLSVKTRVGIGRPVAEEWLGFLLEQDIDALAVHGRTVAQQSEGEADWGTVALAVRLRDAAGLDTLIVGNGDVRTALDFQERAAQTHADGIMIGRGIFENVSIFGAIRAAAQGLPPEAHDYGALDPVRKVELFRRHMTLFRETWGTGGNYHALKKFAKTYLRAFDGASRLVDTVIHTHTYDQALAVLDNASSCLRVAPASLPA